MKIHLLTCQSVGASSKFRPIAYFLERRVHERAKNDLLGIYIIEFEVGSKVGALNTIYKTRFQRIRHMVCLIEILVGLKEARGLVCLRL